MTTREEELKRELEDCDRKGIDCAACDKVKSQLEYISKGREIQLKKDMQQLEGYDRAQKHILEQLEQENTALKELIKEKEINGGKKMDTVKSERKESDMEKVEQEVKCLLGDIRDLENVVDRLKTSIYTGESLPTPRIGNPQKIPGNRFDGVVQDVQLAQSQIKMFTSEISEWIVEHMKN